MLCYPVCWTQSGASVVGSQLGTMNESTYNELFVYISVGKYPEGATKNLK